MALEVLRKNDTLVVWKLDRLGRTVKGLIDLVNLLHQKGIHFKSLPIMLIHPLHQVVSFSRYGKLAQMERELMAERTKAGLAAAKAKGRVGGRKRKMTKVKLSRLKRLLSSARYLGMLTQNLGISIPTLYRWIPASNQG